ncbi:MAG: 50S ribosome-binding GTPase, partial [Salinisphaera sp.]|nr:50S ribosome-binding GTPase [Salinisphaera sp.]
GDGEIVGRLEQIIARLSRLRADAGRGAALREGLRIAIVGAPNVGKSSLLNCLAGRDSAIVTDLPGTTRDVLREVIHIDGLALHLADTAGLRATSDPIEAEGVRRTRAEIAGCDQLLLLVDDRCPDSAQIGVDSGAPQIIIRNKCDLSGNPPGPASGGAIRLSARTGDGVCALVDRLKEVAGLGGAEPEFMARRRHLDALDRAAEWLDSGQRQLCQHAAGELLAEDLRAAHAALGTITGEFTNDDLLGEIFAGFCVGK